MDANFLAPTQVLSQLNWRYAAKAFGPERLTAEQRHALDESLRLAPSSYGLQPWKFLAVRDQATKDKLVEHSWGQQQVSQCDTLYVLCRRTDLDLDLVDHMIDKVASDRNQDPADLDNYKQMIVGTVSSLDEQAKAIWADKQVYIALGFLLETAALMGVDSCPMEGFLADEYAKVLDLGSKKLAATVVCPVGIRSSDDSYANLAKSRFESNEVLLEI